MSSAKRLDLAMEHHLAGRWAQAEGIYRQILEVEPQNPRALQLLGVLAFQAGHASAGIELVERAIRINPNAPDYHSNLGVIFKEIGRMDDAIDCYRRALSFDSSATDYHWNLAVTLLARGDFAQGWEEFEWRLHSAKLKLFRGLAQPRWNGEELAGKTILLHTEGGFGDALQFIRYAPLVARRGGRVLLECQPELVRLFRQLPDLGQIIARGETLPAFDYQVPLQSLPRIFRTDLTNIPGPVPCLAADAEIAEKWIAKLAPDRSKKIGLCWAGSFLGGEERRSRSLATFAPLAEIPGVTFHSLQTGPDAGQPVPAGMKLVDHHNELMDFAESAGLVANLDLVISVDTSVVHLAGAMGKPVWTLLPFSPDFRWLLEREDSPWYPTMRLFRQEKRGEWGGVTTRIARELGELAAR
jgi:tetratricopeptide (TPR) repeat protein